MNHLLLSLQYVLYGCNYIAKVRNSVLPFSNHSIGKGVAKTWSLLCSVRCAYYFGLFELVFAGVSPILARRPLDILFDLLFHPTSWKNVLTSQCSSYTSFSEGPVLVWDENRRKKSKRYIFLLNDALLITKRDGARKFWLRVFISLASPNVNVENMSSGFDCAFRASIWRLKISKISPSLFSLLLLSNFA